MRAVDGEGPRARMAEREGSCCAGAAMLQADRKALCSGVPLTVCVGCVGEAPPLARCTSDLSTVTGVLCSHLSCFGDCRVCMAGGSLGLSSCATNTLSSGSSCSGGVWGVLGREDSRPSHGTQASSSCRSTVAVSCTSLSPSRPPRCSCAALPGLAACLNIASMALCPRDSPEITTLAVTRGAGASARAPFTVALIERISSQPSARASSLCRETCKTDSCDKRAAWRVVGSLASRPITCPWCRMRLRKGVMPVPAEITAQKGQ
mmetsp:Transcript_18233/g.51914  ORF Transcript_18233/g.51914 Transcript_18233/m.51914 type:complete len:263 (+) Transcript_18233:815-1603(+)